MSWGISWVIVTPTRNVRPIRWIDVLKERRSAALTITNYVMMRFRHCAQGKHHARTVHWALERDAVVSSSSMGDIFVFSFETRECGGELAASVLEYPWLSCSEFWERPDEDGTELGVVRRSSIALSPKCDTVENSKVVMTRVGELGGWPGGFKPEGCGSDVEPL